MTVETCPTCRREYIPDRIEFEGKRKVKRGPCMLAAKAVLSGFDEGVVNSRPFAGHPAGAVALDYWSLVESRAGRAWPEMTVGFIRRADGALWADSVSHRSADFAALGNLKMQEETF